MSEQFCVRSHRNNGWFFIDNELISIWGEKLGVHGIAVYNVLAMHANNETQETFPSYNTIAKTINCSRRKVIDIMKTLESFNIIEKTTRQGGDGVYDSNVIKLLDKKHWIRPKDKSSNLVKETSSLHAVVNEVHHTVNEVHHPLGLQGSEPDTPGSASDALVQEIQAGSASGAPKLDSCNHTKSNNINTPAREEKSPPLDPLTHVFELQATHNPSAAAPTDFELYFGSRDKFIQIYVAKVGSYPNPDVKDEIIRIAQLPGASPEDWERAIRETNLNYSGNSPPPLRYIQVFEHGGGDYGKFTEWMIKTGKWKNNNNGGNQNGHRQNVQRNSSGHRELDQDQPYSDHWSVTPRKLEQYIQRINEQSGLDVPPLSTDSPPH